jgi:hypothetical protein
MKNGELKMENGELSHHYGELTAPKNCYQKLAANSQRYTHTAHSSLLYNHGCLQQLNKSTIQQLLTEH